MVKKLFAGGIAALSLMGLSMPMTQMFAYNAGDYVDNDYPYNDGSVSQGVHYTAYVTDEECTKIALDNISYKEITVVGRVVVLTYEATSTTASYQKKEQWYPASYERKTNLPLNEDGTNPNEFNNSLQGFLKDLIGNDCTTGVSYDSFNKYLDYLKAEHEMTETEAEAWRYDYRVYNNCLTGEDKAKIEEEKKRADEYLAQIKKEQLEAQKKQEEVANATSKQTMYEREANMLERSLPDYVDFDKELFLSLREAGYSYLQACEKSQKIDYSKAMDSIGSNIENNKDWFDETYKEMQSESFQESLKNLNEKISKFLQELTGGSSDGE